MRWHACSTRRFPNRRLKLRPDAAKRLTCETGRVETRRSTAYFEWSALPGSDPAAPATWRACMPALGHTVTEARIAAEFERLELADFCRAYLNWWPGEIPACRYASRSINS